MTTPYRTIVPHQGALLSGPSGSFLLSLPVSQGALEGLCMQCLVDLVRAAFYKGGKEAWEVRGCQVMELQMCRAGI